MKDKETPFSILFVAFDEHKNKGGEKIFIEKAQMCGLPYNSKQRIGVRNRENSNHPYAVHQHLILQVNNQKVFY